MALLKKHKDTITITVEGGLIQHIEVPKSLPNVQIKVMDFDTDGDSENLQKNEQGEEYVESVYEAPLNIGDAVEVDDPDPGDNSYNNGFVGTLIDIVMDKGIVQDQEDDVFEIPLNKINLQE